MKLELAWHLEPHTPLRFARAAGDALVALSRAGALLCFALGEDAPRLRWRTVGGARAFALAGGHVVAAEGRRGRGWQLVGYGLLDGAPRWRRQLEAGRVARVFAAGERAHATLSREGRFVLESVRVEDGASLGVRPLDRRRAMVAADGARAWTRDADGVTEHALGGAVRRETALAANGPMSERGPLLVTSVGDAVVAVREGAPIWRTPLPARDLREVAERDGVLDEEDEEDVWEAEPGRAALGEALAWVPDMNGSLHALDLASGALRWTAHSAHYPSSDAVAVPCTLGAHVAWPASDEHLYLVDAGTGAVQARLDLEAPFEGAALALPDEVVALADGA
ncbi:MAG TPA: PQQ-binding-like beta-propeller repeat protein, partial [Polyangiaceae bacterium LLY-WYZ-15_(1-7)]|nr:PQQ-binding-like beta-propeller repeat protein [Polyangiaceae bacterium LLY-WYZ-15_(1-7)]